MTDLNHLATVTDAAAYLVSSAPSGPRSALLVVKGRKPTPCHEIDIVPALASNHAKAFAVVSKKNNTLCIPVEEDFSYAEFVDVTLAGTSVTLLSRGETEVKPKIWTLDLVGLAPESLKRIAPGSPSTSNYIPIPSTVGAPPIAIPRPYTLPSLLARPIWDDDGGGNGGGGGGGGGGGSAPKYNTGGRVLAGTQKVDAALVLIAFPDPGPAAGPKAATSAPLLNGAADDFQAAFSFLEPTTPSSVLTTLAALRDESRARAQEVVGAAFVPWPFVYGPLGAIANAVQSISSRAHQLANITT
jgi:hypothetical protein